MLILIILLVIGFAAVSTTLIINGNIGVQTNKEDFDIIFSSAKLDNVLSNELIDDTKKRIVFVTPY